MKLTKEQVVKTINKIANCPYCKYKSKCNNSGEFYCFEINSEMIEEVKKELIELLEDK